MNLNLFEEKNIINATELRTLMTNVEESPELVKELKRINTIIQNEAKQFGSISCLIYISKHLIFPIKMILDENEYYTEVYKDCLIISWSKTAPKIIN
jgi:hypothetical protein